MSCRHPLDVAHLADYWLGMLPSAEEEIIEEHLFGCGSCATRLQEVMALAEGLQKLAREGSLRMVVSDAFLRSASEDGLRIREYAPPAGGDVECTVTTEDDLLIGRLAADFGRAKRVDVCILDANRIERARFPDIPFNAEAISVAFQNSIEFVKAAPDYQSIVRLVGLDEAGVERVLGEYTFNHTRTLPGPGSW
jgi:hypothetical protein